jgi:farnesyl-diphosphate farnesyltransferase
MFDLETFPGESERELTALATPEDLDRYTYLVAGCVGEFWTRMCAAHLPLPPSWKNDAMEPVAVRFGKGLQLVNVLRDLPRDLRIGRCYLPSAELAATGLRPEDLLEKNAESKLRPIYDRYLGLASAHLDAGWQYTLQIPPSQWRLRLACALPLLIGWKTIKRLRESPAILDPSAAIKVPRREVKLLVARTFLISRSNRALDRCRQTLRP